MIVKIINKYKSKLILATIFSALSSAISIYLLAMINSNIQVKNLLQISESIPLFLMVIASLFTITFLSQILLAKLGTSFVFQLRTSLLAQTSKVSYENLERIGSHRVLATVTSDVTSIAQALAILPVFTVNLATILFCLGYLALQSVHLFMFLIGGLFVGAVISLIIMKKGREYFILLREKEDRLFSVFKTLVDGSKELNINHNRREFFFREQAEPSIEDIRNTEIKAKKYWILSDSMIRTLLFLTLGIILYAAHFLIKVEINVLTSFIIFTTYIVGPIAFVQATSQSFVRARIAYRKIAALNLSDKDSELTEQTTKEEERWGQIVFNDVSYEYSNGGDYKFALGPINLKINQGENLFICGGNGSGKSTFAKLLVGLYSAQKGAISFAEQEVKTENMQWYRNHFSTIFSDFYLFEHVLDKSGKIVEKKHIEHHLKELELFEKVDVVDGKVTSTDLSQGQRKRLAMLLAYSEDASIYLFDEWAADQDPTFREYFYKKILPELKQRGKTLVVITHDDKYFGLADRLIKFDNGVISKNLTNDMLLEPVFSSL